MGPIQAGFLTQLGRASPCPGTSSSPQIRIKNLQSSIQTLKTGSSGGWLGRGNVYKEKGEGLTVGIEREWIGLCDDTNPTLIIFPSVDAVDDEFACDWVIGFHGVPVHDDFVGGVVDEGVDGWLADADEGGEFVGFEVGGLSFGENFGPRVIGA